MKKTIAVLSVALVLSLGYNAVWITSSESILELSCKSHFAEVHADAIRARDREDWARAAHLFAYLMDYHPRASKGCLSTGATETDWLLPMSAIAWDARSTAGGDASGRIKAADAALFSSEYRDAARKAGIGELQTASTPGR